MKDLDFANPEVQDAIRRLLRLASEASDQLIFISNERQVFLSRELKQELGALGFDTGPLTHVVVAPADSGT